MASKTGGAQGLKCLSVQQPFAQLLSVGLKRVENRDWATPYRGPVVIHAGLARARVNSFVGQFGANRLDAGALSFGALVGVADLADVVRMHEGLEGDLTAVGPWCWVFDNPRLLPTPVPSSGKLKL